MLRAMRRSYRSARFLAILDEVRASVPEAAISTDIIVGFPGETDDDFAATLEVVAKALDHHLVEDAAGEDAALGEIADVGQRGRACRVGDCGRDLVAVLRQQHLGELAEPFGLLVAAAGVV